MGKNTTKPNNVLDNNSPEIKRILEILGLDSTRIRYFSLHISYDRLPIINIEYFPSESECNLKGA